MDGQKESASPDGGYGWVVMFCSMGCLLLATTVPLSFSMLIVEFTETFGESLAVTGLTVALFHAVYSVSALVAGVLVHAFGPRIVCMAGAVIACTGIFAASFSPNLYAMYVTLGVILGSGFSGILIPSYVVTQLYFDKRRAFAANISSMGQGIATLVTAPIYSLLINHYGWRGAMVIHAGIVLQAAVLGACYRPLPKHKDLKQQHVMNPKTEKQTVVSKLCDSRLLRQRTFSVFVIGSTLWTVGFITLITYVPSKAVSLGMTKMQGALLLLTLGICSVTTRLVNSILSNLKCVNRVLEVGVAALMGGVLMCLIGSFEGFITTAVAVGASGISSGVILGVVTTATRDIVGRDMIAKAQGLLSMSRGVGGLVALPLAGWLYDVTLDYAIPFYVNGSIEIVGGLCIIWVFFIVRKEADQHSVADKSHFDVMPGKEDSGQAKYDHQQLHQQTCNEKSKVDENLEKENIRESAC